MTISTHIHFNCQIYLKELNMEKITYFISLRIYSVLSFLMLFPLKDFLTITSEQVLTINILFPLTQKTLFPIPPFPSLLFV